MLHNDLAYYIQTATEEYNQITAQRKADLQEVSSYVSQKLSAKKTTNLVVICTHNSRRSHFGQFWLQAATYYYHLPNIRTFSGGTEATAFHPNAVAALERAGVNFSQTDKSSSNPQYLASWDNDHPAIPMFSKKYDHSENPRSLFAAIMVCSDADEACPFIPGADARFSLPYQDPKQYDNTPQEREQYDERCRQIAREMLYAMSSVQ
ncbi:protein-tyrosine-phosphatase [Tunicatimonas pelagia]|uniref:protein-tyrosine-phosphatase n=1 Tax=Tunicatimonas pelagia TaxID=931531 RepID=UPI0026660D78|nr:protein-tyrosine-phosphatase [Tunicatimonas pelagia]WKN40491.1 protein-tyrosine-phosphatase [Tunicatimonas pelagia]